MTDKFTPVTVSPPEDAAPPVASRWKLRDRRLQREVVVVGVNGTKVSYRHATTNRLAVSRLGQFRLRYSPVEPAIVNPQSAPSLLAVPEGPLRALVEEWREAANIAEHRKYEAMHANFESGENINRAKMLAFRLCADQLEALLACRKPLAGLTENHENIERSDISPHAEASEGQ